MRTSAAPGARPWVLSRSIGKTLQRRTNLALLAGTAVAAWGATDWVVFLSPDFVGYFVVFPALLVAAALLLEFLVLRGRLGAGLEVQAWAANEERRRWRVLEDLSLTTNVDRARALLAEQAEAPASPWLVAVAVVARELERPRRLADAMPATLPWERFERERLRAFVAHAETGRLDDAAARRAAEDLRDPEERLTAGVLLALNEARRRADAGGDWLEPLASAHNELAGRADGMLRLDYWPRLLPVTFQFTAVLTLIFFLLGQLFL